jgi:hypothetical protein
VKRIVLAGLFLLMCHSIHADILATGNGYADVEGGEKFTHRLYARGQMARWEFSGQNMLEGTAIYRGDRKVLWVLDPNRKAYFELPVLKPGESDMKLGMLAVLYGVAVRAISKEQKAEMEKAIQAMPLPEALVDFAPKGKVKSGRWTCERYEVFFNGMKRAEYLTADASALKIPTADYIALSEAWRVFNDMYARFDFIFPDPGTSDRRRYRGFPVKWAYAKDAHTSFSLEFTTIERREASQALFELPDGYKKTDVFDLIMAR